MIESYLYEYTFAIEGYIYYNIDKTKKEVV
jgi:hypothetical protein